MASRAARADLAVSFRRIARSGRAGPILRHDPARVTVAAFHVPIRPESGGMRAEVGPARPPGPTEPGFS